VSVSLHNSLDIRFSVTVVYLKSSTFWASMEPQDTGGENRIVADLPP
jgi:hypothetical protein